MPIAVYQGEAEKRKEWFDEKNLTRMFGRDVYEPHGG